MWAPLLFVCVCEISWWCFGYISSQHLNPHSHTPDRWLSKHVLDWVNQVLKWNKGIPELTQFLAHIWTYLFSSFIFTNMTNSSPMWRITFIALSMCYVSGNWSYSCLLETLGVVLIITILYRRNPRFTEPFII